MERSMYALTVSHVAIQGVTMCESLMMMAMTSFTLCAGPGPALDLDGTNVVFGQIIEGLDIIQQMAAVPTIKPNDTLVGYNQLAQFFGDDRAAKARDKWDKPLQALVITDSGML